MTRKKLTSLILSVLLLLAAAAPALSVHAADGVTITLVFSDGEKFSPFFELTVEDGTAEAYGLKPAEKDHTGTPVETVTVLDALVKAHAELYGEEFNAQTIEQYLIVTNGFASKMFEQEGGFCFALNDATPHDDVLTEYDWGSYYTGYALDTTCVQDGDVVTLYKVIDSYYWSDYYPLFSEKEYTVNAGQTFSVSVNGYGMVAFGCCEQSVIDANTVPMEGAQLYLTKGFDEELTPAGTLDADGSASISITQAGTWYLVVKGTVKGTPVTPIFRKITVNESPNPTKDTQLNVPASEKVGYKSNVVIIVTADNVPDGYEVALYDGDTLLAKGENSIKHSISKIKADKTFTAKVIDADGNVQQNADGALEKTIEVKVNNSFFAVIKAFFLRVFGVVPTVELKP